MQYLPAHLFPEIIKITIFIFVKKEGDCNHPLFFISKIKRVIPRYKSKL